MSEHCDMPGVAQAARELADDYDLIGTQDAEWMATAWRRFANKLSSENP